MTLREALRDASRHHQGHPGPAAVRAEPHPGPRADEAAAPGQQGRAPAVAWGRQAVDVLARVPGRCRRRGVAGRPQTAPAAAVLDLVEPAGRPRRGAADRLRGALQPRRAARARGLLDVPRRHCDDADVPVFVQQVAALPAAGRPPTPDDHGRPRHRRRAVPRLPARAPGTRAHAARTGCSSASSTRQPTSTTGTS